MPVRRADVFRAAVGEDAAQHPVVRRKERPHAIVEEVRRGDGRFLRVQLGETTLEYVSMQVCW
jgi:hypothetical protein